MAKLCTVLILLTISLHSQASTRVEFVSSRIHGLLIFVEAVSDLPNRPPHFKKVFDQSKHANKVSGEKIDAFRSLDGALNRGVDFGNMPADRYNGLDVKTLVMTQTAFAKDLPDLRQRILGTMNFDELNRLMEVMAYFEPIYDEMIWKPNHKQMMKTVEIFQKKSKQWKVDELFEKAVKFYDSSWPEQQIFRISLYPIPKEADRSNGQSYGSFESVGVIMGENIEGKFGVVFHELCHSLYGAQSAEVQKKWSSWFSESSSPYATLASFWLNEGLATTLGNGWAYVKAGGKLEKKSSWYMNDKIDGFAKAMYPKAVEYLESGKSVDKEFMNSAIQMFGEKFPGSLSEFESFLTEIVLLSDGSFDDAQDFRRNIRKHFRVQSIDSGSPIDHEKSIADIRNLSTKTVVLLSTQANKKQIEALDDLLPGMKKIIRSSGRGNQIGLFTANQRRILIILLKESEKSSAALAWMAGKKTLEKPQEFIEMDLQ